MAVDMVVWAAGAGPVTRTAAQKLSLPFPTTSRGNIQIEPTLQVAPLSSSTRPCLSDAMRGVPISMEWEGFHAYG
jgi:hypothetical protein